MNLHKIMIGIGIALIVFIPIWIFFIVPELLKMPGDYEREFDLLGTEKPNYEIGGNSEEVLIYKGIKKNKFVNSGNNKILAELYFKAQTISGEPLFEITEKFDVNRKTREIVSGPESEVFLIPPMHLDKKSYTLLDPTNLVGVEINFERVENINGLEVFYFKGNNLGQDNTEGYTFLELIPEVYSSIDDIYNELWIEPTTGKIVKFKQSGESNYFDKLTNKKIHTFTQYTNEFNEDTIANQVRLAQNEKQKIFLIEWIVPILLALIGIALIFSSFIGSKFIENEKPIFPKSKPVKKTELKKSPEKAKKPLVTFEKKEDGK